MAAWLAQALRCPVEIERIKDAPRDHAGAPRARRPATSCSTGPTARPPRSRQPDQPEHRIALPIRQLRECLAEELRRLDADEVYGEVLQKGLAEDRRMTPRHVVVHPDAPRARRGRPRHGCSRTWSTSSRTAPPVHVVLTGGTVGIATLARRRAPAPCATPSTGPACTCGGATSASCPTGDPDRNETQARDALLDALGDALPAGERAPDARARRRRARRPRPPPTPTPPSWRARPDGADVARVRRPAARHGPRRPRRLAVPRPRRARRAPDAPTVGVHGSPKPPPERVSLTFDAIRGAREVWVVAAGAEKAPAVASRPRGAPVDTTPAAGALGTERTLWLVDVAATRRWTPAPSTTAAAPGRPADLDRPVDDYFAVLRPRTTPSSRPARGRGRRAARHRRRPDQGKLLHLLAQAAGARRILEIGTLGGYSTLLARPRRCPPTAG